MSYEEHDNIVEQRQHQPMQAIAKNSEPWMLAVVKIGKEKKDRELVNVG